MTSSATVMITAVFCLSVCMMGYGTVNTADNEVTGKTANYLIQTLTKERFGGSITKTDNFDSTTLGEDSVQIRIPYSELKVKSGDRVRICFHDVQERSSASPEVISEDKATTLK